MFVRSFRTAVAVVLGVSLSLLSSTPVHAAEAEPSVTLNGPYLDFSFPVHEGYQMVTNDGYVTAGNAPDHGSLYDTNTMPNQPIVGMETYRLGDKDGYWIVAADGGIFTFGDAPFHGSTGGINLNKPIVGMAATPDLGGTGWLHPTAVFFLMAAPSFLARPAE